MARITWDETGNRFYETGVKKGVLYKYDATQHAYANGVAWNGLTAVTESPSGADETALYADDIKYLSLRANEEFGGTIEAYTYPDEFMDCDGSKSLMTGVVVGQQSRSMFGLSYVTTVGNDVDGNDYGYKIHLVYGATCSPSERAYSTINDSPEAITFSWEFTTTPVAVDANHKPSSILTIDTTKLATDAKAKLSALEDVLYGTDGSGSGATGTAPRLPLPDEVITLLS